MEKVETPWRVTIKVYDRQNGEQFFVRCYNRAEEDQKVNEFLFSKRYIVDSIEKNPNVF